MDRKEAAERVLAEWLEDLSEDGRDDPEELFAQHPELADELRAGLEGLGWLSICFPGAAGEKTPKHPEKIGEFRIVRELGRGGMGIVYEAVQEGLERPVALKVLATSPALSAKSIRRFRREAKATARLHHTNIVPIFSLGIDDGYWHYAMELVPGRSLSELLRLARSGESPTLTGGEARLFAQGPERHRELARLFAGIADALHAAHQAGVVHRDIKPSNLLLDLSGEFKLIDFGLAHCSDPEHSLTLSGDMVGTPGYMSPEQASSKLQDVDQRTDVFSLGSTLYEALTLRPAFTGETLQSLCLQITQEEPPRPRTLDGTIPRELETIVVKAMEKERRLRYQDAAGLARDLRCVALNRPIHARRVGTLHRTWRRVRAHPRAAAVLALLVLVSAAALFLGWSVNRERQRRGQELLDRSYIHRKAGRGEKALADLDAAAELLGWSGRIRNVRGIILKKLGRYEDAIAEFLVAEQLEPELCFIPRNRGEALSSLGRYEEALEAAQLALRINPANPWNYLLPGALWTDHLGDAEKGLQVFEKGISLTQDVLDRGETIYGGGLDDWLRKLQLMRAVALYKLGRLEDALGAYRIADELRPLEGGLASNYRRLLLKHGDVDRATEILRRTRRQLEAEVELHPDDGVRRARLAYALHELGMIDESLREFDRAFADDPERVIAGCFQVVRAQAIARNALGRRAEAMALGDRLVAGGKADATLWAWLIFLKSAVGQRDEAKRYALEAVEQAPKDALLQYFAGCFVEERREEYYLEALRLGLAALPSRNGVLPSDRALHVISRHVVRSIQAQQRQDFVRTASPLVMAELRQVLRQIEAGDQRGKKCDAVLTRTYLSFLLLFAREGAEAAQQFAQAFRSNPDRVIDIHEPWNLVLAQLNNLATQGELELALDGFKRLTARLPKESIIVREHVRALMMARRVDLARGLLPDAVARFPDDGELRVMHGSLLPEGRDEHFRAALALELPPRLLSALVGHFRAQVQTKPADPKAHADLLRALEVAGDEKGAEAEKQRWKKGVKGRTR